MLYAQLYTELQQGRRYWFEDEENARIMKLNEPFQQVNNYEQMIALTYQAPEDTPDNAKYVSLQLIRECRHILYDFCEGVKAVWQTGFKP